MLREIGSDFWDNVITNDQGFEIPKIKDTVKQDYLISGRSAIGALAKGLKSQRNTILLPAYNCESVIKPFEKEGWRLEYYPIHRDFTINQEVLKQKVVEASPSAVYFQGYFGFHTQGDIKAILLFCKERNIKTIEDLTHSCFSEYEKLDVDYYVLSLRKYFAMPEGGMLIHRNEVIKMEVQPAIRKVLTVANRAFLLKEKYMEGIENIEKEEFCSEYRKLNKMIDELDDQFEINDETLNWLMAVDFKYLKARRQENFMILLQGLKHMEWFQIIFNTIPDDVVPLFFPIFLSSKADRSLAQSLLSERNIFCPVIWPQYISNEELDRDTKYIYDHILCIPCDQRYGREEMQYIIDTFKELKIGRKNKRGGK